jgi:hypothetical protein
LFPECGVTNRGISSGQALSQAAKELVEHRDRWLNAGKNSEVSPDDSQVVQTPIKTSEFSHDPKRTLSNLYNTRPTLLDLTDKRLD